VAIRAVVFDVGGVLDVEPQDVVCLDDVTANVETVQAAGWQVVLHESRPGCIAELERIIATAGP
jgi:FMN phosphatase YigB (HAD superfamily)